MEEENPKPTASAATTGDSADATPAPLAAADGNGHPSSSSGTKTEPTTPSVAPATTKGLLSSPQEDDIEAQLGISEYLSYLSNSTSKQQLLESQGFIGVVKGRYSDFVVHEVSEDGTIARLTDTSLPKIEEKVPEKPLQQQEEEQKEAKLEEDAEPPSKKEALLKLIKDETIAAQVFNMLESHDNESSDNSNYSNNKSEVGKFVVLPALEKTERRAVHEWIRSALPNQARADTLDGKIRIWHIKFEKEMPNYHTFGNNNNNNNKRGGGGGGGNNRQHNHKKIRKEWPKDRPDFLRFVLYKENMDTTTATKEVNRRGSTGRIGYAGMKDKRGITTQFCTLYRTTPDQIITSTSARNNSKNNRNKNNRQDDNQAPSGGGGNTKQKGVSVVQVGNFEYVNQELRLGMLNGNRFDIVIRNIKTLHENDGSDKTEIDDENEDVQARRRDVLEQAAKNVKAKGFINYFGTQRFGKFHDTHLVGIAVLKGDYRKAIDILMSPKTDDRPDVTKAREDWENRFQNGRTEDNERDAAKRVLKRMNRYMTGEISVMQSLSKRPMDYKRAFGCIPRNLRAMYIHAVQSLIWNKAASYRVSKMDNAKVLVGDLVLGEGSKYNVRPVTEEDIAANTYSMEDIVIPSVGVKTSYPTNELGCVIKSMMGDIGITADMFKKVQDRELILNGDYRKVICHPTDFDYEIKEYYDPLQPLLQTDLMKLHGEDIRIEIPDSEEDPTEMKKNMKTAMVVGFTLPSSSYATIALRELMKLPTSNEFQKDQAL